MNILKKLFFGNSSKKTVVTPKEPVLCLIGSGAHGAKV
jgi:hypothetical protein